MPDARNLPQSAPGTRGPRTNQRNLGGPERFEIRARSVTDPPGATAIVEGETTTD